MIRVVALFRTEGGQKESEVSLVSAEDACSTEADAMVLALTLWKSYSYMKPCGLIPGDRYPGAFGPPGMGAGK